MGKAAFLVVISVAVALALGGCARKAPATSTLTPRGFQDRVVAEIMRIHPDARIRRLGDHQLSVGLPGSIENTTELARGYAFYQDVPANLDGIVRDIAAGVGPHENPKPQNLVVLVRPASFQFKPPLGPALVKPLAGNLVAYVAVDQADSFAIAPESELRATMKMDSEALWTTALGNTRAHVDFKPRRLKPGVPSEISMADGLASSLLVFDDFWDSPELTAAGPVVVAVLARDSLLLAPLSDTKTVQALRKLMADVRDDPNGLTNDLIVRRSGRWEVLR